MSISLDQIKKLRNSTKSGVMDCRKALQHAGGDFEKAKEWLKEKNKVTADKKKDKKTRAGLIGSYIHSGSQVGALVKLNCETDFVAETKEFKQLVNELCMQIAAMDPKNIKELMDQEYIRDPGKKIKDLVKEVIGKIGENIEIKGIARLEI